MPRKKDDGWWRNLGKNDIVQSLHSTRLNKDQSSEQELLELLSSPWLEVPNNLSFEMGPLFTTCYQKLLASICSLLRYTISTLKYLPIRRLCFDQESINYCFISKILKMFVSNQLWQFFLSLLKELEQLNGKSGL